MRRTEDLTDPVGAGTEVFYRRFVAELEDGVTAPAWADLDAGQRAAWTLAYASTAVAGVRVGEAIRLTMGEEPR